MLSNIPQRLLSLVVRTDSPEWPESPIAHPDAVARALVRLTGGNSSFFEAARVSDSDSDEYDTYILRPKRGEGSVYRFSNNPVTTAVSNPSNAKRVKVTGKPTPEVQKLLDAVLLETDQAGRLYFDRIPLPHKTFGLKNCEARRGFIRGLLSWDIPRRKPEPQGPGLYPPGTRFDFVRHNKRTSYWLATDEVDNG